MKWRIHNSVDTGCEYLTIWDLTEMTERKFLTKQMVNSVDKTKYKLNSDFITI